MVRKPRPFLPFETDDGPCNIWVLPEVDVWTFHYQRMDWKYSSACCSRKKRKTVRRACILRKSESPEAQVTDGLRDSGIHRLDIVLPSSPKGEKMPMWTRSVQSSVFSCSLSWQLEVVAILLALSRECAVCDGIQELWASLNVLMPLPIIKEIAPNCTGALTVVPSCLVHEYLITELKT